MRKQFKIFLILIFIFGLFFVVFLSFNSKKLPSRPDGEILLRKAAINSNSVSAEKYYFVVRVIDGDTIIADIGGNNEVLRLIGIDAPETVHPSRPAECFGAEASNKAKELLTEKRVTLESDKTQGERDKYGRLLRYVFLEDGTNFNKFMISEGYAYEYTYNLSYKYQDEFKQAEQSARESKKGLWADGVCDN